jgi:hypothetical protein
MQRSDSPTRRNEIRRKASAPAPRILACAPPNYFDGATGDDASAANRY